MSPTACGGTWPTRALSLRVGGSIGLVVLGGLVTLTSGTAQFVFAAAVILVLGLPHGASDHLVVRGTINRRRPHHLRDFLASYLLATAATLLVWRAAPGPALFLFLLLSAVHFATDDLPRDEPAARLPERFARGLMPLTLPAAFHHAELAQLFATLSTPVWGAGLADAARLCLPPVVCLACLAVLQRLPSDTGAAWELAGLLSGLTAFPPLVGFALYFALVHSRGQTAERMRLLKVSKLGGYLRLTFPTLAGAFVLFSALAVLAWMGRAPAIGPLFVGLSALTVPHMLVTPLFKQNMIAWDHADKR